jgi:hypothetical protein
MLKWTLIALGIVVAGVVAFIAWRVRATMVGGERSYGALAARIATVEAAIAEGRDPDPGAVARFAADRATRRVLYEALEHHGRLALFPREYLTQEAMAEADLALWLNHPNELGAIPDEMERMASVPVHGGTFDGLTYYVFRYRMNPPHWAASDGWLAGVTGPYPKSGPVIASAPGTFSRFEAYTARTPAEHVAVTHAEVVEKK